MTPIIAGIVTYFNAYSSLDAVGGPWLTAAEDNATFPYCVIEDNGGPVVQLFGSGVTQIKTCNVRFKIFHSDEATLRTYQAALHTRFDRSKFALTTGKVLSCLRQNDFIRLSGFDKNNEAVYRAETEYQIVAQTS